MFPSKYFIIAVNTIGNGRTTSPSTSKAQPRMKFPRFSIRDMVTGQHRLLTEHLKVNQFLSVVGLSMGGMQTFQWAVSHPGFAGSIVAIISMPKTTAWVTAIRESHRKAFFADPEWSEGNYTKQPERGWRAVADSLAIWVRHWTWFEAEFPNNRDVLGWLKAQEDALIRRFDATDYLYQTWAEDLHNIADTPGFNGDLHKAPRAIKAKVLLMPGLQDILHPADASFEAHKVLRDSRVVPINSVLGQLGGGGVHPADIAFTNRVIAAFLDEVTEGGRRLQ